MSTEKMEPVAYQERVDSDTWGFPFLDKWVRSKLKAQGREVRDLYTASQLQAAVAAERERCAKVCESLPSFHQEAPAVFKQCAEAIRQLGDEQ